MAASSDRDGATPMDRALARLREQATMGAAQQPELECATHGSFKAGHTMSCPRCEDERRAASRLQDQLDACNLRGRFRDTTFENFEASTAAQRSALATVRDWAESATRTSAAGLILLGPVGTGKTHLLAATARHMRVERKTTAALFSAREIVRRIRATWSQAAAETEEQALHDLAAGVLALDEIGAGFNSEAERVQLFEVIDRRYQLRRPTIVASNLPLAQLRAALGERSFDRLREGARVIPMDWESYRGRA